MFLLKSFIFIVVLDVIIVLLRLRLRTVYFPKLRDITPMCMANCNKCKKHSKCHDLGNITRLY